MKERGQLARPRVVGRYAFQHEIASGGMATVYLGKLRGPLGFSPIVAIKAPHEQFTKDASFVRMFLDEARLAARIRHPNIVPVIDVHDDENELFLVLEYIHGEPLSRLLKLARVEARPLSLPIISAIMCDVLRGLQAAHDAKGERGEPLGIVHRDVSPQNILVGVDGIGRVLDFGVAKAAGRLTMTRDGEVKGKFAYMAPEQLRGEEINRQADVYAAAIVLWEMLTGRGLFKGENEGTTVARALFADVPPPSSIRAGLPAALDALVERGLARERSARFSSAKEMELALQAILPAAPPSDVGAWVSGLAFDALEARAKLIAEIESSAARDDVSGSRVRSAKPDSAPARPVDASALVAPAPAPRIDPPQRAFARWIALACAVMFGSLAIWYALRGRVTIALVPPVAIASAASGASPMSPDPSAMRLAIALAPSAPVEESPTEPSATVDPSSPTSPVSSVSSGSPAPRPVAAARAARKTHAAPAAAQSASSPRCTVRNADGTIGFDEACLRASQKK